MRAVFLDRESVCNILDESINYLKKIMATSNQSLNFFIILARVNAVMARRFDGHLGGHHGLGFNDFIILFHLNEAENGRLRRIDLAEKIGLTASGVTRLLAPMEKIGLIQREATEHDARVSFVAMAPGGKRLFQDALATAIETVEDILPQNQLKDIQKFNEFLSALSSVSIY